MLFRRFLAVVLAALILTGPAFAADWVVMRLRGDVQTLLEGNWVPLKRGDIVANEQMIRTLADGHAELQRDKEVVTLGINTEVKIHQDAETGYTTVLQDFGRVEVDAEAKRVKHFEVRTPYLAAVVKGTHFVVTSDEDGASVAVDRGAVAVMSVATDRSTTIKVGQTATVKRKTDLVVSGPGPWPDIVDPGVNRTAVVAALGGAIGSAPMPEGGASAMQASFATGPDAMATPAPTSITTPANSGNVRVAAATTALFTGLAASNSQASTGNEPAQPVSIGIVVIGALLGAALGALALLLRRGI